MIMLSLDCVVDLAVVERARNIKRQSIAIVVRF